MAGSFALVRCLYGSSAQTWLICPCLLYMCRPRIGMYRGHLYQFCVYFIQISPPFNLLMDIKTVTSKEDKNHLPGSEARKMSNPRFSAQSARHFLNFVSMVCPSFQHSHKFKNNTAATVYDIGTALGQCSRDLTSQQTRDFAQCLVQWWSIVCDAGTALNQHSGSISRWDNGIEENFRQQTQYIDLRLNKCWSSVLDAVPTLSQHLGRWLVLPGIYSTCQSGPSRLVELVPGDYKLIMVGRTYKCI